MARCLRDAGETAKERRLCTIEPGAPILSPAIVKLLGLSEIEVSNDGDGISMASAVAAVRASLRGELIEPSDPIYDEARAVYNGMIDRRPCLIARCADAADVMAAVKFAREQGLLLIRSF